MTLKITHLQLHWGLSGAREKFEEMVAHLIRNERPDTRRVRIVRGDGGVDSYQGDFCDPEGICVYQIKFFPGALDDSRKQQIRNSFSNARDSKEFKVKSWTLCLAIDLSIDEIEWFDNWSAKESGFGIEIRKPWTAFQLEGLLLQEKNRSIREKYFREESTELIRSLGKNLEDTLREIRSQGARNLKVRINPVRNSGQLLAQIRMFNSGKGPIYVTCWWAQWQEKDKRWGNKSILRVQGTLPIRIKEQDLAELLIIVDSDPEALDGIGVVDGDDNLWLASNEDLVLFKHKAIVSRLPVVKSQGKEFPLDFSKVIIKASSKKSGGMLPDQFEVSFENLNEQPISIIEAKLSWSYTPPRAMPNIPGKPSVAESGCSVILKQMGKASPINSGNKGFFILEEKMSGVLVEIVRGDVRDQDIIIEFEGESGACWKATMEEIPIVVRNVANSIVETIRGRF